MMFDSLLEALESMDPDTELDSFNSGMTVDMWIEDIQLGTDHKWGSDVNINGDVWKVCKDDYRRIIVQVLDGNSWDTVLTQSDQDIHDTGAIIAEATADNRRLERAT